MSEDKLIGQAVIGMQLISAKTAAAIYNAHREVIATEKLLSELDKYLADDGHFSPKRRGEPIWRDTWGHRAPIQMSVDASVAGSEAREIRTIYQVRPELAVHVLRAHLADAVKELAHLMEMARLELSQPLGIAIPAEAVEQPVAAE